MQQYLNNPETGQHVQRQNPHCFHSTTISKHIPNKLVIDGTTISDQNSVLSTWAENFESLSKSQIMSSAPLMDLECCSFSESDNVLDVPFEVEEVEHALKRLKLRRSEGPR